MEILHTSHDTTVTGVFFIASLNVQFIFNKLNELEIFLYEGKFSCLCVSEHWCNANNFDLAKLDGFSCASLYHRNVFSCGGVAIYVKTDIKFKVIDVSKFCIEKLFEVTAVLISHLNTILIAVYRSPSGNINIFMEQLEKLYIF